MGLETTEAEIKIYITRNATGKIVGADTADEQLQPGQTREVVIYMLTPEPGERLPDLKARAFALYAGRFLLSADKQRIAADGLDEAIVTVQTNLPVTSLEVSVNGVTQAVAITRGKGTFPVSSAVPGEILIEPADIGQYGGASLIIFAGQDIDRKAAENTLRQNRDILTDAEKVDLLLDMVLGGQR